MKVIYSLFFLTVSTFSFAQEVDDFSFLGNGFDKSWKPQSFRIFSEGTANSNALNTGMFSDFLLRDRFRDETSEAFRGKDVKDLNFYSRAAAEVEYKINKNWGVMAEYGSVNAYTSSLNLFDLILFGNADYEGEEVNSDKLALVSYSKAGINATYLLAKSEKVLSKLSFGVFALDNYRQASTGSVSLFTAPRGEYIDISASSLSVSDPSDTQIDGIGLNVGYDLHYKINNKNYVSLAVKDLNVTRLLNRTGVFIDTSFRFSGLGYDILDDTSSLESFVDSNYLSVVRAGRRDLSWITLPSRINLQWSRKLNCRAKLLIGLEAIDLGRFGISGRLGVDYEFSDRFRLLSTLGYGNFSGIVWRESAEYRFNRVNVFATLQSLHALVIPKLATNYGATIGISTHF